MLNNLTKPSICLSDVQGNKLKVYGTALLNYGVHDVSGNVNEIGTRFLVSDTVKFVLSVGELGRRGWNTTLGTMPVSVTRSWMSSSFDAQGKHLLFGQLVWDFTVRHPGKWWR